MSLSNSSIPQAPVVLNWFKGKPLDDQRAYAQTRHAQYQSYLTVEQLTEHLWARGMAIFPGCYDVDEYTKFKAEGNPGVIRRIDFWRGTSLMLVDIDGGLPAGTPSEGITRLLDNEIIQQYVGAIFPSSSYRDENPKFHLIFMLDRPIRIYTQYEGLYLAFVAKLGLTPDPAMKSAVQTLYGTDWNNPAKTSYVGRAKTPDMAYVNPFALLPVDLLMKLPPPDNAPQTRITGGRTIPSSSVGINGASKAELAAALKPDFKPMPQHHESDDMARRLDQAQFVKRLWSTGLKPMYSVWLEAWMSAHVATAGHADMLQYFLNSPEFWQHESNIAGAKSQLEYAWGNFAARNEGYTPATFTNLAKLGGWGSYSQYDLKRIDLTVDAIELKDGLTYEAIPRGANALIKSQTGSGKSEFALGYAKGVAPGKVAYIAPFITLAYDAQNKAQKQGIATGHYRHDRKPNEALATTLQYISRAYAPDDFEIVILDEIHALMKQLFLPSQMSRKERWRILKWLRKAFSSEKVTVLAIDADINENTAYVVERLAGRPALVIKNEGRRVKAPASLITEKRAIPTLQAARDKPIVVSPDTPDTAQIYHDLLETWGVETTLITSKTSNQKSIRAYMRDVDAGFGAAPALVYNTAMGSGVSVTKHQADTVIQFVEVLSADIQRQKLNRFRRQGDVYIVSTVKPRRRRSIGEIKAQMERDFEAEKGALQHLKFEFEPGQRNEWGALIDEMYIRLRIEEDEQFISPQTYLAKLLNDDGRELHGEWDREAADETIQERKALKELRERMKSEWREGELLPRKSYIEVRDMSKEDRIKSEIKTTVNDVWGQIPPEGSYPDAEIADAAEHLKDGIHHIDRALSDETSLAASVALVADENTGKAQIRLFATTYILLTTSRYLLPDLRQPITHARLVDKADKYIEMIRQLEKQYDALIADKRYRFKVMSEKYSGFDLAMALLDKILGHVGIELEATRQRRRVDGKMQHATDGQGRKINTYTVKNLDMLLDIIKSRRAAQGIHEAVKTTWAIDNMTLEKDMIDDLTQRGLLKQWAEMVQEYGADDKYRIYQELLVAPEDRDAL